MFTSPNFVSNRFAFQAKRDAFQRRHPIAHAKRAVHDYELLPYRVEFLIIGGGLSGSSTAYWLKQRFRDEDFKVAVVEDTEKVKKLRSHTLILRLFCSSLLIVAQCYQLASSHNNSRCRNLSKWHHFRPNLCAMQANICESKV